MLNETALKTIKHMYERAEDYGLNDDELAALRKAFDTLANNDRKYARWIKCGGGHGYKCSECAARVKNSAVFNHTHRFCYKCGAQIIGVDRGGVDEN